MLKNKIVFFGTPSFAVVCLKKLLEEKFNILAVVTAIDKRAGRGKKLKSSDIKNFAIQNGLDLFQPENMKDDHFVEKIKLLKPDFIIVVAFRMMPKKIWEIPSVGTINLHASLLPNYRGAAPINWAIINNEKYTGVTTFYINENIDSGDILLQKKVEISENETAGTLHDKLSFEGSQLLCETIDKLSKNKITAKPQKLLDDIKLAPKINAENSHLNLGKKIDEIKSTIRGLSPSPGAWVTLKSKKTSIVMKSFDSDSIICENQNKSHRLIIKDKKILISHKEGYLVCKQVQMPNKKRMLAHDLLNGYTFDENISVK